MFPSFHGLVFACRVDEDVTQAGRRRREVFRRDSDRGISGMISKHDAGLRVFGGEFHNRRSAARFLVDHDAITFTFAIIFPTTRE